MSTLRQPQIINFAQLIEQGYMVSQNAHHRRTQNIPNGPALPSFPKLAQEICGTLPVGITVLHAPPGDGKSALAQQIATQARCPAIYVSFEMSPLEILHRGIASATSTYLPKLRNGSISPQEWREKAIEASMVMQQLSILDATAGKTVHINHLKDAIHAVRNHAEHLLLLMDSASTWITSIADGASEYEAINAGLMALDELARQEQISVLAVAEQNRSNRGEDSMEATAGSRKWEYLAELMFSIKRSKKEKLDRDGGIPMSLTIMKNRSGPKSRVIPLLFEGYFMRFSELDLPALQEPT